MGQHLTVRGKNRVDQKRKVLKSSSYAVVHNAVKDPLTLSKLNVFISTAKCMQGFLQTFQSSKPMVPFLAEKMSKIMKELMEKFIKKKLVSCSISSQRTLMWKTLPIIFRIKKSALDS
jgi:hypothetical protein